MDENQASTTQAPAEVKTDTAQPTTLLGGNTDKTNTESVKPSDQSNAEPVKTEGDKGASKDDAKKGGIPEKYEFKFPEGMTVSEATLSKFSTTAKEMGLSQDGAQKLMDLAMENATNQIKESVAQWDETRMKWVEELKADKEFGGDKLPETITRAKRTLGAFSTPGLLEFLETSGFGDNAELIKLFARIDKKIGEDKVIEGTTANNTQLSDAELIYGKKQ